ncbi:hypothetical protein DOY81_005458 [Sarcophaga bullata]|nr:hypothetical protein DOY81_005458 [Sarcophaga bullata]
MSPKKIFFICQIFLLGNVLCFHLIESDLQINSFAKPQKAEILKNHSPLEIFSTAPCHKPIQQDAAVNDRPQNEAFLGDDVENHCHHQHQHHHHLPNTKQPQYQLKYENNFQKHDATTKPLSSTLYQRQQQEHEITFEQEQQQQEQENQNVIETTTTTTIIIQNGVNQPHNLEKHQQLTVNQAIIKQKQQQQHQYQQLFLSDFKLLNAVNCRNKRQTQQTGYNNGNNNNYYSNANKNDNNNGNDNVNANVNANGNQHQRLYTTFSIQYYPYHQQQQQSLQYQIQQQQQQHQHPQYQLQYYQQSSQNLQKNYNNNNNNSSSQLIGNGNSLSIHPSSLPLLPAATVASIYTSTLALPAINMQHKQQQQQQQLRQSLPQKSLQTLPLPTFLATTKTPPTATATATAASTLDSFEPLLPLDIINEYDQDNVNDDSNTFVCKNCCNPMELHPPNCTECCSDVPLLHVQTLKTLGG